MVRRLLAVFAFLIGVLAGGLLVRHVSVGASLALGLAIIVGVAISAHVCSRGGDEAWALVLPREQDLVGPLAGDL